MTAIRLPSRCPVLEWPGPDRPVVVSACYDLLTGQEATGKLELRLQWLHEDKWLPLAILYNDAPTVSAALEQARSAGVERAQTIVGVSVDSGASFRSDLARTVAILLLNLSGEPDVVRVVHPGAKPERDARMRRRDPERWADIREPTVWDVGVTYRKALEQWEIEQAREIAADSSGRSVRPHMRRAHSHLYWTGPGRTEALVKFLLPIPVKGKLAEEEAVTAAGLDPRLANAVRDAFFGRSVTPRYYRPLADVSVATATKDLAMAVAAGLLRPVGRARSRTYQAGEALYTRIGAALGVPITESGEPARGAIIGELTKRVASERPR